MKQEMGMVSWALLIMIVMLVASVYTLDETSNSQRKTIQKLEKRIEASEMKLEGFTQKYDLELNTLNNKLNRSILDYNHRFQDLKSKLRDKKVSKSEPSVDIPINI